MAAVFLLLLYLKKTNHYMSTKTKLFIGIIVCSTIILIGMSMTKVIKTQWVCLIPFIVAIIYGLIVIIRKGIKGNYDEENSHANPYARVNKFYNRDIFEHLN
jgi:hypothetical protein